MVRERRVSVLVTKGSEDALEQFAAELRNTWLKWGLLPLAAGIVLTLMAVSLAASPERFTERALELRFQIVLALGAGLFLIGFSLDSHWTNAQKLARRIARAAGLQATPAETEELKKKSGRRLAETLQGQAQIAADSIMTSTLALTIIGGAVVVTAILAAAAGLGLGSALLLLLLAAEYQFFVYSRHPYYKELLAAARAGELTVQDPKTPLPSKDAT